jgi:hypothetical protein
MKSSQNESFNGKEPTVLIEVHANPGAMEPAVFADAVADTGLDAVVITRTNRTDGLEAYVSALDEEDIEAYVGVELPLDRGAVVFIPRSPDALKEYDWSTKAAHWTLEEINERLQSVDGAVIAAHPYFRDETPPMGDRVYRLNPLSGVVTRIGRGRSAWDRLADQVADKRNGAKLASSGGVLEHLGCAGTVVPDSVESQADLVDALLAGACLPVELDDPDNPRDRVPPQPIARTQGEDGRRDGRRDDRRGGRRDDRRGGRSDDRGRGRGPRGGRGRD